MRCSASGQPVLVVQAPDEVLDRPQPLGVPDRAALEQVPPRVEVERLGTRRLGPGGLLEQLGQLLQRRVRAAAPAEPVQLVPVHLRVVAGRRDVAPGPEELLVAGVTGLPVPVVGHDDRRSEAEALAAGRVRRRARGSRRGRRPRCDARQRLRSLWSWSSWSEASLACRAARDDVLAVGEAELGVLLGVLGDEEAAVLFGPQPGLRAPAGKAVGVPATRTGRGRARGSRRAGGRHPGPR